MKNSRIKNSIKKISPKIRYRSNKVKPDRADDLHSLFLNELKDIYGAEKALVKVLPKMIKHATSNELKESLSFHYEVTKGHKSLLEEVFYSMNEKATSNKCEGMEGILKEADEIIGFTKKGEIRDAGIISACQKTEHYEIATYGTLCSFANTLEENRVASMLHQILEEEIEMDEKLTLLAKSINASATGNDFISEDVTIVPILIPF